MGRAVAESRVGPSVPPPRLPTHAPPGPHLSVLRRASGLIRGSVGAGRRSCQRRGSRLPWGVRRHGAPPRLRSQAEGAARGWRARGVPCSSPSGPGLQAGAKRSRALGYLRRRGRRVCEPGSAFFPTLSPANERLRSARPPPALRRPPTRPAAPAKCRARLGSRPTSPARDKGKRRPRPAPASSYAGTEREDRRPLLAAASRAVCQDPASSGCPGRRISRAGREAPVQPRGAPGGDGAQSSRQEL